MADERSHISWSFIVAMVYCGAAYVFMKYDVELVVLAFFLVVIGSVIPNIDSTDEGITGELSGLIGALVPVLFFKLFPDFTAAGSVRIALTIIAGYISARVVFTYLTRHVFAPRGALHSLPAVILFFEIAYLLFPGIHWKEKVLLGGAMGIGALSHLLLDSFTNIGVVKKAVGGQGGSGTVLKFYGKSSKATWTLYILILVLGWFVARDIIPALKMRNPVHVDPEHVQQTEENQ